jgi:hypothetical protein
MCAAPAQLFLSPGAEEAWTRVARPWLEAGRGSLSRRLVVVPTRGQALAWKQRCVREALPLLGVEFLTPGLARRKWLPLLAPDRPLLGREFLLLGLRGMIAERLARLEAEESAQPEKASRNEASAIWRSLRSDPDRALEALDDFLQAGFAPGDFPRPEMAWLALALRDWAEGLGHGFGPTQAIAAALGPLPPGTPPLASDLLVLGLGAENANEFFNVAALLRRVEAATVIVPAPALRGAADAEPAERPDEAWVTRWESFLGAVASPIEAVEEGDAPAEPELLLGAGRRAEAELISRRVVAWLGEAVEDEGDIGVVFPGPGPLHRLVSARLRELGVPHHDLVGRVAAPPVDTQVLRGVVEFWARGARLDEALALWPRLKALNLARLEADHGAFRAHVDERFHETCDHALAVAVGPPETDGEPKAKLSPAASDLRRLASVLLPAWEAKLSVALAVGRLRAVAAAWGLELPEGFETLAAFGARESRDWPREPVAELVLAFLPETADASEPPPQAGLFANVVLTTRRRAEQAPWARLILAQANAGEWPRRRDPNPWLDDSVRVALNRGGRGAAPLLTGEDASRLERDGFAGLAREARLGLAVSAAARDEAAPDRALAPNAFLERLLWARGEHRPQEALARLAAEAPDGAGEAPADWRAARAGRRDPTRPFDKFFLCIDDTDTIPLPARLSPSTLEKGVADPAVLWFRGLLRLEPAAREPLERALPLRRGQLAHRLLADAVRPSGHRDGDWGPLKPEAEARDVLEGGLATERASHPPGQWYWEAEQGRLEALCRALLKRFYATGSGEHVVVECWLPEAARLTLPGWEVPVRGRMDVARADRPAWAGARVHLYDYKSGAAEKALDAARMAERAESLQLAIYLDAVRSLGASEATVWKLTADEATALEASELDAALSGLPRLMEAMKSGRYGALTPDRNPHGGREPWPWPVACTPIPARDLKAKFALTFGEPATVTGEERDE